MEANSFLDAKMAAAILGIKVKSLYKMTSEKRIPYYSPGGKKLLFKEKELIAWIEKSRVPTDEELREKCHNMK